MLFTYLLTSFFSKIERIVDKDFVKKECGSVVLRDKESSLTFLQKTT